MAERRLFRDDRRGYLRWCQRGAVETKPLFVDQAGMASAAPQGRRWGDQVAKFAQAKAAGMPE